MALGGDALYTQNHVAFEDIAALMDAAVPAPNRPVSTGKKPARISN
jgi:hypothetical protein